MASTNTVSGTSIATLDMSLDFENIVDIRLVDSSEAARWPAAQRYAKCLDSVVTIAPGTIMIAYCPTVATMPGQPSRSVFVEGYHGLVAQAAARTGLSPLHGVVVFGSEFVRKMDGIDDVSLKQMVVSDLSSMISGHVGLKGSGKVSDLLPWLVGIAGAVSVVGPAADEGFVDRTIASSAKRFADFVSNHGSNSMSKMLTIYPDFLDVAHAAAEEAKAYSASCEMPLDFESVCELARLSVIEALRSVGVAIQGGKVGEAA
jgi:hypothetical protein